MQATVVSEHEVVLHGLAVGSSADDLHGARRLLLGRDESATVLCCVRDPGLIHGIVEYMGVHTITALESGATLRIESPVKITFKG